VGKTERSVESMRIFTYLFPLLIIGGFAFYYFRIYRKGKAAGGGMAAGFNAAAHEKWDDTLAAGERVNLWGGGIRWRPWWQFQLAHSVPALRLVWPTVSYTIAFTNSGRMLIGEVTTLGGLKNKTAYPARTVRVLSATEEKRGLSLKLNPFVTGDHQTYEATFALGDRELKMVGVSDSVIKAVEQGVSRVPA
jgi:hypothetical protein